MRGGGNRLKGSGDTSWRRRSAGRGRREPRNPDSCSFDILEGLDLVIESLALPRKFCADTIHNINYKDVKLIGPFVPERGKILPRRISGTCAMHQRKLQTAIKRARQIALIPYVTD